ncbi:MAG TPA: hypothetical protein VK685_03580 [Candidatus Acidoferrum sp.]|nr:hypothetical protein [Candidatus Acidoferrum sp.]
MPGVPENFHVPTIRVDVPPDLIVRVSLSPTNNIFALIPNRKCLPRSGVSNSNADDTRIALPVTSLTQGRRVSTMDRNLTPLDVHLPADIIKLAIDQHGPVIRLSYMEIASGINSLLHRGIPNEVIAQVVSETIEALTKEAGATLRNQQR